MKLLHLVGWFIWIFFFLVILFDHFNFLKCGVLMNGISKFSPCITVHYTEQSVNPLNAELNPICHLLALLGVHHFLHVSRIRVKSLNLRLRMSHIYIYIYIYIYRYMEYLFLMFLDRTQRRTRVGRTPLDEWSARRRDLYLTTHNTHNRQISMPPAGLEPTISAGERPQTYALHRAATTIKTYNTLKV